MNIDCDPVRRTMTSFFLGRGFSDCDEGDNDPAKFPATWKAGQ
jgi:hypothetical protein